MEVPCTPGSHTSPPSATTDCRADFTGKAAEPMDPCNKSYLSAQILQQERMLALTDGSFVWPCLFCGGQEVPDAQSPP